MKGYPSWFSFYFILGIILALIVSGILLAPSTLEMRLQWQMPWRLIANQHAMVAAIHVLVGLITFGLIGALWSIHMRQEWNRKKNRFSGNLLVAIFFFLGVSGIAIYYVANEFWLFLVSITHLGAGLLIFFIYFWHSLFVDSKKTRLR